MAEKAAQVFGKLAKIVGNRKTISIVVAAVVVLAGLLTWRITAGRFRSGGYVTAKVGYADLTSTVSATATVEALQQAILTFKNQGFVRSVYVSEGDFVRSGTLLAEEDTSDFQNELDQARANLQNAQANYDKLVATQPEMVDQAEAQLAQAESDLDLAKTTLAQEQALFAAGAVSRAALDGVQNTYQTALAKYQSAQSNLSVVQNTDSIAAAAAQVKVAQAQVGLAENNLAGSRIVSPMDGYVGVVNGSTGQWTQGGAPPAGTSISSQFSITVSSSRLELLAEVNEADISKVSRGDKVSFTVDTYPDRTFTGRITSLSPYAVTIQGVQYYDAYASIDDWAGLESGLPANVNITYAQKNHVLAVPRAALDYAAGLAKAGGGVAGGKYVAVLYQGKPRLIPVQTGIENGTQVEISGGLQAGRVIVVNSQGGRRGSGGGAGQTQGSGNSIGPFHFGG